MSNKQAPPEAYFDQLPIPELIIAARRAMHVCVRKTFFPYALAQLTDEMSDSEIERFKAQIDTADGFLALIIRKRLHYKLWPTDTGAVIDER